MYASLSYCLPVLSLASTVFATPYEPTHIPEKRASASPLNVTSVEFIGNVTSNVYTARDLGFSGAIGNTTILTYGDSFWGNDAGLVRNSWGIATDDPLTVVDNGLINGEPHQFVPWEAAWGELNTEGMGITTVLGVDDTNGIVFFYRLDTVTDNDPQNGAGVATVTLSADNSPVPNATRLADYWWEAGTEPTYGDVAALKGNDDYFYAYGHYDGNAGVYLTKVPIDGATDLNQYQYWNGQSWQDDRLMNPSLNMSVGWEINQGQVNWSNYYNCYVFIYVDNFADNLVQAMTSTAPEGPWSESVTVFKATPLQENNFIYAGIGHPQFDTSGKTLVITYTNPPNVVQAIKALTFDFICIAIVDVRAWNPAYTLDSNTLSMTLDDDDFDLKRDGKLNDGDGDGRRQELA
ncbi:MAG: hypothetical protein M1818_004999 [Claussenomyces sp. TS43310]|nr:MAG: hypothetical protein M1818_004999 [Claussenomyces sp. TS43310]